MKSIDARNRPRPRRDRLIQEMVHDPYQAKRKLPEPTVCPICKAVFQEGRWNWAESWPLDSAQEVCQACNRASDNYPAGIITLKGGFAQRRKAELLNLARHHEALENAE